MPQITRMSIKHTLVHITNVLRQNCLNTLHKNARKVGKVAERSLWKDKKVSQCQENRTAEPPAISLS